MGSRMGKRSLKNSLMFRSSSLVVVAGLALMANSQEVKAQEEAVVTENVVEEVVVFDEPILVEEEVVEDVAEVTEYSGVEESTTDEDQVVGEESLDVVSELDESETEVEVQENLEKELSRVTEFESTSDDLPNGDDVILELSESEVQSATSQSEYIIEYPVHNSKTGNNLADERDYEISLLLEKLNISDFNEYMENMYTFDEIKANYNVRNEELIHQIDYYYSLLNEDDSDTQYYLNLIVEAEAQIKANNDHIAVMNAQIGDSQIIQQVFKNYNQMINLLVDDNISENTDVETERFNINNQIEQHKKDIEPNQDQLNNLQDKIDNLFYELANLEAMYPQGEYEQEKNNIRAEISTLNHELTNVNSVYLSLQAKLNTYENLKEYLPKLPNVILPNYEYHDSLVGKNIAEQRDFQIKYIIERNGLDVSNYDDLVELSERIDSEITEYKKLNERLNERWSRYNHEKYNNPDESDYYSTVLRGIELQRQKNEKLLQESYRKEYQLKDIQRGIIHYNNMIDILNINQVPEDIGSEEEIALINEQLQMINELLTAENLEKDALNSDLLTLIERVNESGLSEKERRDIYYQIGLKESEINSKKELIQEIENRKKAITSLEKYLPENYKGPKYEYISGNPWDGEAELEDDEDWEYVEDDEDWEYVEDAEEMEVDIDKPENEKIFNDLLQIPQLPEIRVPSTDLKVGEERIVVHGETGLMLISDRVTYEDGVEISREIIRQEILKEATASIIEYGVAEEVIDPTEEPINPDDEVVKPVEVKVINDLLQIPQLPDMRVPSAGLKVGEELVMIHGETGLMLITDRVTYEDGVEVSRELIRQEVLKEATVTIIQYGVALEDEESSDEDDEEVVLPGDNEEDDSEVIDNTPDEEENESPDDNEDEETEVSEEDDSPNYPDPSEETDDDENKETDNSNVGGAPSIKPSSTSNGETLEGTENPEIDENPKTTINSESEATDSIELNDLLPEDVSMTYSGVMLPQTGESNSNLWFASSAATVLLGLGLIKGRKEEIEQ